MNTKLNKQTLTIIGVLLFIATIVVGYFIFVHPASDTNTIGTVKTVTDDVYGVSFTFPEGEEAFTLVEPPENQAGIQKSYIMLPTKAYNDYKNSESISEAPAGMTVFILTLAEDGTTENATTAERADRMTRLKDWAMRFDGLTQYSKKKAEPEEIEIDGLKALRYQADGLYQQTIYLTTYKKNVYMLVSQYNEESDITKTAFDAFLASVRFD
jgi:hypothetical protein